MSNPSPPHSPANPSSLKLNTASAVPQPQLSKPSSDCSPPLTTQISSVNERPMTARERCMEQQRASLSIKPASSKSSTESRGSWFNDSYLPSWSGELSRSASVPTARSPKVAMESRSSSVSSKWSWASYVLSLGQKGSRQYGSSESEQSLRKVLVRRRLRAPAGIPSLDAAADDTTSDENATATAASATTPTTTVVNEGNADELGQQSPKDRRPTSLISYLHDPDKLKKFSLELESLVNSDFEQKWRDVEQDFFTPAEEAESGAADIDCVGDSASPTTTGIEIQETTAPGTPETPGSHAEPQSENSGTHRLTHVASLSKLSTLFSTSSRNKVQSQPGTAAGKLPEAAQSSIDLEPEVGSPSVTSTYQTSKTLRCSPSMDTLAVIDSELMKDPPQLSAPSKMVPTVSFVGPASMSESSSPSGEPPFGPLPALPTAEMPLLAALALGPSDCAHTPETQSPSRPTWRHSFGSDTSKGPAREAVRSLAVRSSLDIRSSAECSRPARPVRPMRPDVQPQESPSTQIKLPESRSRRRRPESGITALPAVRPQPDYETRFLTPPSVKSLSRSSSLRAPTTPATPTTPTTPTTRASAAVSPSPQVVQPKKPRQALSKSAIKIIVDTDPNTGHFRAGGIAPTSSAQGSQKQKTTTSSAERSNQSTTVRTQGAKKRVSRSGQRKEMVAPRPSTRRQLTRYGSHSHSHSPSYDCEIASSEDEINPLLAPAYSNNNARTVSLYKARPSHSDDKALINGTSPTAVKFDHLASEVVDIRTKLQQQEDSIALMGAVVGLGGPYRPIPASKYRKNNFSSGATSLSRSHRDCVHIHGHGGQDPAQDVLGTYSIDGIAMMQPRPISFMSSTGSTTTTTGTTGRSTTLASAGSGGDGSLTDPSEGDAEGDVSPNSRLNKSRSRLNSNSKSKPKPLKKRMEQARNRASMRDPTATTTACCGGTPGALFNVNVAGAGSTTTTTTATITTMPTTGQRGQKCMSHLSLRGEEWPWPGGAGLGVIAQVALHKERRGGGQRQKHLRSLGSATAQSKMMMAVGPGTTVTTSDMMDRRLEEMRAW